VAAGGSAYSGSFIRHWLHEILFYDFAPGFLPLPTPYLEFWC